MIQNHRIMLLLWVPSVCSVHIYWTWFQSLQCSLQTCRSSWCQWIFCQRIPRRSWAWLVHRGLLWLCRQWRNWWNWRRRCHWHWNRIKGWIAQEIRHWRVFKIPVRVLNLLGYLLNIISNHKPTVNTSEATSNPTSTSSPYYQVLIIAQLCCMIIFSLLTMPNTIVVYLFPFN